MKNKVKLNSPLDLDEVCTVALASIMDFDITKLQKVLKADVPNSKLEHLYRCLLDTDDYMTLLPDRTDSMLQKRVQWMINSVIDNPNHLLHTFLEGFNSESIETSGKLGSMAIQAFRAFLCTGCIGNKFFTIREEALKLAFKARAMRLLDCCFINKDLLIVNPLKELEDSEVAILKHPSVSQIHKYKAILYFSRHRGLWYAELCESDNRFYSVILYQVLEFLRISGIKGGIEC